nr:kinesin-like protein KIF6 isoform X4 [Pelodiscus sinensis]|eukprot:XP_025042145.1 kinesin-like protein KIF6 isoform X4 [Pelodiscus sinensis]
MNQASTRSHCIFTIHISSKEPGSATIRRSKLHLVDLAGSERVAKTGVGGQLLTEAKYINLSLLYLEQVIIALAEKHRSHIPYRNSMMTSVLRDSLGGNCMTTMIATLSLDKRNIDESISTCRFAQRVALIKNEAVLNEEIDPRLMIIHLKKVIQELKDELAMVTGEQRTEELMPEELLELDKLIKRFLEDPDPESTLDVGADMRKIKHCFNYIKQLINRTNIPDRSLLSPDITGAEDTPEKKEELKKLKDLLHQRDNEINILVNMLKKEKKKAQDALFQLSAGSSGLAVSKSSLSISFEEGHRPSACINVKNSQDFSSSAHRAAFLPRRAAGPAAREGQAILSMVAAQHWGSRRHWSTQERLLLEHISVFWALHETLVQKVREDMQWRRESWTELQQQGLDICATMQDLLTHPESAPAAACAPVPVPGPAPCHASTCSSPPLASSPSLPRPPLTSVVAKVPAHKVDELPDPGTTPSPSLSSPLDPVSAPSSLISRFFPWSLPRYLYPK